MTSAIAPRHGAAPQGLADVLERVLNTGIVIAGDIQLNLLDIELLTIKIRLLVASADTAQQMGIDWWKHDEFLSSGGRSLGDGHDGEGLAARLDRIEAALGELGAGDGERAHEESHARGGHEHRR
jgi:hypothetical protein